MNSSIAYNPQSILNWSDNRSLLWSKSIEGSGTTDEVEIRPAFKSVTVAAFCHSQPILLIPIPRVIDC